jgi:uncharacterized protein (DUF488 family)
VPNAFTIYTWGYSRARTFEDLLAALPEDRREPGRVAIIDVRRSRFSRNQHWSWVQRGSLRKSPQWEDYNGDWCHWYTWLWGLGNTPKARDGEWIPAQGTDEASRQLGIAASKVRAIGAVVLTCAEQDHRHCHRVQVAEALAARTGAEIVHL